MEPHLRALRTRWKRRSRGFGVHCGGCAGATSGGWSLAVGLDANLLSIEGVGPWQLAFFARCWRVGWHRLLRGALYLVGRCPAARVCSSVARSRVSRVRDDGLLVASDALVAPVGESPVGRDLSAPFEIANRLPSTWNLPAPRLATRAHGMSSASRVRDGAG